MHTTKELGKACDYTVMLPHLDMARNISGPLARSLTSHIWAADQTPRPVLIHPIGSGMSGPYSRAELTSGVHPIFVIASPEWMLQRNGAHPSAWSASSRVLAATSALRTAASPTTKHSPIRPARPAAPTRLCRLMPKNSIPTFPDEDPEYLPGRRSSSHGRRTGMWRIILQTRPYQIRAISTCLCPSLVSTLTADLAR